MARPSKRFARRGNDKRLTEYQRDETATGSASGEVRGSRTDKTVALLGLTRERDGMGSNGETVNCVIPSAFAVDNFHTRGQNGPHCHPRAYLGPPLETMAGFLLMAS